MPSPERIYGPARHGNSMPRELLWRPRGEGATHIASECGRFTVARYGAEPPYEYLAFMRSRHMVDGQYRWGHLAEAKSTVDEAKDVCRQYAEQL